MTRDPGENSAVDAHARIVRSATAYRRRLRATILPYWLGTVRDGGQIGYLLAEDYHRSWARGLAHRALRRPEPRAHETRELVDHARLVWLFSLAHRTGYGEHDEYLTAAARGYRALIGQFFDQRRDGYYWSIDRAGAPVNDAKVLYGQAFVIYAFVEFARAGGDAEAVQRALALHRVVSDRLHDAEYGGWREHADADWSPLPAGDRRAGIDVIGRKSGDTTLHWMEGIAELYDASGDEDVRRSLVEVLDVGQRHFFPADPGQTHAYCYPDWTPDPAIANSWPYGHNVEFAWLMIRAERALGCDPSWDRLFDYVDHALEHGFDHRRGGLRRVGLVDAVGDGTDKVFWVQAEMVAALTDSLVERAEPRYATALAQLLTFVERHQMDGADGVWLNTVTERGGRRIPRKSGTWKVGYHEVRAITKLVDAFAE